MNSVPTLRPHRRAWLTAAVAFTGAAWLLTLPPGAQAGTMYKCQNGNGGTEYSDHPCNGRADAPVFKPKQPLTVISSESLTGKPAAPKDARPAWLKGPDPIGDCKAKGGTIDKELRACMIN